MTADRLPRLPPVDANLLGAYERAHAQLADARARTDPAIDLLFRRFAFDTTGTAVADIAPSFRGGAHPPLLPAPRAFLSAVDQARIDGVRAGLRYVDSRLAMWVAGYDTSPLRPEAPFVLHALTEGRVDNPRVTNPGMIRATAVWQESKVFAYPEPREVSDLFAEAIARAMSSPAPACVRGAWLLYATVFVHPFCDGNGRVSRLLYLLVAGEELPAQFDWGVAEQWAFRSEGFRQFPAGATALDATLDLGPLVSFAIRSSVDGAALMRRRIGLFTELRRELARAARCTESEATGALAVAIRRNAALDVLAADLDCPPDETLELVGRLVAAGLVQRVPAPPSRRVPGPARPCFAVSPSAAATMEAVMTSQMLARTGPMYP